MVLLLPNWLYKLLQFSEAKFHERSSGATKGQAVPWKVNRDRERSSGITEGQAGSGQLLKGQTKTGKVSEGQEGSGKVSKGQEGSGKVSKGQYPKYELINFLTFY